MIYAYGITQQGTYHIKNNIVCQDSHNIIKCGDFMAVAAVADGLGSEKHSDVASKIAAKTSTDYCAKNILNDTADEAVLDVLHDAFALAQKEIESEAKKNHHELDQYDTTLSLAVLRNGTLFYGNSGDSGIVALTEDGLYEKVTEQQRDSYGRVFPLYFGDEKWVFGKYEKAVASVLLATDGMLETLFPYLIQNEPVNIYVALARFFMDVQSLGVAELGEVAIQEKISDFVASIADEQVNDDKTVVVISSDSVVPKEQPESYYAEPDWKTLKKKRDEEWRRAAYPHLYKEGDGDYEEQTNNSSSKATEVSSLKKAAVNDTSIVDRKGNTETETKKGLKHIFSRKEKRETDSKKEE